MYSGGGYYDLVVVTPRPQTFLCERDNLKIQERISSILYNYVDWYRWEDSWEARWAQSDYLWATQGPPNRQKCKKIHIGGHIWNTGSYFVPLLYICLLFDEVLLPCKFGNPGFDVRALPGPPPPPIWKKLKKNHILDLNLNCSYQIASLFHMYIDMGERIAG